MTLLAANAEAWCPFGGVEAVYTYLREGNLLCSLGVSNFYALAAVIASVLLLRRAFCGYMCPLGTMSEWLRGIGRRFGLRMLRIPAGLDRVLSLGKYLVLAVVLVATWRLGELAFSGLLPRLRSARPPRRGHYLLGLRGRGSDGSLLDIRHDAVLPMVLPSGSSSESCCSR